MVPNPSFAPLCQVLLRCGKTAAVLLKPDVAINLQLSPEGTWVGSLDYVVDLFEESSTSRMAKHFHVLWCRSKAREKERY